jgi:addiction module RelE/StbE family toxin
MRFTRSKRFIKQYQKLPAKIRVRADEKLILFVRNQFDPVLENHAPSGQYKNSRSISITGNFRLIYELTTPYSIRFLEIGTHHELYGK